MRKSLLLLTFTIACIANPTPARADDAADLLAKAKAFAGWSFGDPSMAGLRLTGTTSTGSIVDLRRGTLWRRSEKTTDGGLATGLGFTGSRFWRSNVNGFTVPIIGDGATYRVSYSVLMNEGIPLLTGMARGVATVNGTSAQIVRVNVPNGFPIDAYIDPSSGKLVRAVIDPDGEKTSIDILGYSSVEGKQVISKWKLGSRTVEMTKVERAPIADTEFLPPDPSAKWQFGSTDPLPIAVTNSRVYIDAAINGTKGRFILDSGSSGIALNGDYAQRANLASFAASRSVGVSGAVQTGIARAETLQIGPHILRNLVVRTGLRFQSARENVDGLLGFDFLAGAIVDVDIVKKELSIFDPALNDVTAAGPVILADLTSGIPVVPAVIDGSAKVHLIVDSGNPMVVLLNDEMSKKVTMRFEGYSSVSGAAGDSQDRASCGHGQTLALGPVKYSSFPLCFWKTKDFAPDGGLIGFDFLKHFNLTFDYPNSRLYLTPNGK